MYNLAELETHSTNPTYSVVRQSERDGTNQCQFDMQSDFPATTPRELISSSWHAWSTPNQASTPVSGPSLHKVSAQYSLHNHWASNGERQVFPDASQSLSTYPLRNLSSSQTYQLNYRYILIVLSKKAVI